MQNENMQNENNYTGAKWKQLHLTAKYFKNHYDGRNETRSSSLEIMAVIRRYKLSSDSRNRTKAKYAYVPFHSLLHIHATADKLRPFRGAIEDWFEFALKNIMNCSHHSLDSYSVYLCSLTSI